MEITTNMSMAVLIFNIAAFVTNIVLLVINILPKPILLTDKALKKYIIQNKANFDVVKSNSDYLQLKYCSLRGYIDVSLHTTCTADGYYCVFWGKRFSKVTGRRDREIRVNVHPHERELPKYRLDVIIIDTLKQRLNN